MCSICGVFHTTSPVLSTKEVDAMGRTMLQRGPDQQGHFISGGAALQHNRLAIIDVEHGLQPMTRTYKGCDYTIVYNGEIYNTPELTTELKALGITPQTYCCLLYTSTDRVFWERNSLALQKQAQSKE